MYLVLRVVYPWQAAPRRQGDFGEFSSPQPDPGFDGLCAELGIDLSHGGGDDQAFRRVRISAAVYQDALRSAAHQSVCRVHKGDLHLRDGHASCFR